MRRRAFEGDGAVTGEPTFVAAVDSHAIEAPTFAVDPSNKFSIVGNQESVFLRHGAALTTVLPSLAAFPNRRRR